MLQVCMFSASSYHLSAVYCVRHNMPVPSCLPLFNSVGLCHVWNKPTPKVLLLSLWCRINLDGLNGPKESVKGVNVTQSLCQYSMVLINVQDLIYRDLSLANIA